MVSTHDLSAVLTTAYLTFYMCVRARMMYGHICVTCACVYIYAYLWLGGVNS